MADLLDIEIAWSEAAEVRIERRRLPAGSRVADALLAWGGAAEPGHVGVFGRVVPWEQPLQQGDRVEIYSPLLQDPKTARRERAKKARRG